MSHPCGKGRGTSLSSELPSGLKWIYPVQLDEYEFLFEWLRGQEGKERAVDVDSIECVMGFFESCLG
jgi:hypothetical protein